MKKVVFVLALKIENFAKCVNIRVWAQKQLKLTLTKKLSSQQKKHTLLPLDDCLFALLKDIPVLTRSSM